MSKNLFRFIKKKAKKYAFESTKFKKVDDGEDGVCYHPVEDTMQDVQIDDADLDHGAENSDEEDDHYQQPVAAKKEIRMVV
jgi:hypothetical protein